MNERKVNFRSEATVGREVVAVEAVVVEAAVGAKDGGRTLLLQPTRNIVGIGRVGRAKHKH